MLWGQECVQPFPSRISQGVRKESHLNCIIGNLLIFNCCIHIQKPRDMSTWIVCWFSKKLQYVLKHVYYIHPEMKISLPKCWVRYAGSTFYHWWNHVFFHQSLVFITRRGSRMCYIYIQVNGHLIFLYFLPLILVVVFVVILSVPFFST